MNKHGLTKENMVATLPPALRTDPSVVALAEALGEVLAARPVEIDRLRIYPAIDRLDERLLDILAYDFKVDWWDADWDAEKKRRTLKTSWQVHKTLGTKAAVEKAASAIYPMTRAMEWFEYGGEPYHFRLDVDLPEDGWTQERHKKLMWGLEFYKNLRSHLDGVAYLVQPIRFENHQAFWFTALQISLRGERNRDRPALEALTAGCRAAQSMGSALALTARTKISERQEPGAAAIRVRAWASLYPRVARFNGRRRFDGSYCFDQGIRGPAMVSVRIRVRGAVNRNTCTVHVTSSGMWKLDGTYRLDGRKKLNARSEN